MSSRGALRDGHLRGEGRERHLRESIFSTRRFASVFASVSSRLYLRVCVCVCIFSFESSSRSRFDSGRRRRRPPPRNPTRVPFGDRTPPLSRLPPRPSPRARSPSRRGSRASPPREADRRPRPSPSPRPRPSPSPSPATARNASRTSSETRGSSAFVVITHPIGRIPTPFSRASFTSSPLVPSRASSSRRASHSTSRAGSPSQGCKNATAPRHAFDPSPSTRVHVPNASPSVDVGTAYGARDLAASVAATANAVRAPARNRSRPPETTVPISVAPSRVGAPQPPQPQPWRGATPRRR